MADNLSQKSNKSNEKTKYSNVINRTTSETMRLGEPEKVVNHPTSLISSTPTQRKKTPSFQITSVTVGSRTSNDGGDDSADDLDESHTDDMSDVIDNSRITDIENETPSYSEDTFSKEDVFFNASTTALGSAPVIPTSSQYGLAIVAAEGGNNILNAAVACANTISGGDVHVSVTDAGNVINIVGSVKPHETEMRDGHAHHAGRNERFKVVKIESTEPFKRGRWLCMDYLDHTMQQPSQQAVINVVRSNDSSDATTVGSIQYVGPPDSGVVITDGPMTLQSMDEQIITVDQSQLKVTAVSMQEQHQAMVAAQHQIAMASLTTGQNTTAPTNFHSVSPGQTLQTGLVQQHITSQSHQSMQQAPASIQQSMQQTNIPQSLPQNIQQVVSQQQLQQQSQQTNQQQNLQGLSQHAQSLSQVSIQQNMTAGPPQQQAAVAQHQSLPPQQIQQVMAAANLQQMQQQQQIQQQMTQHQAFVPQASAQQAQSQHITSQPGQSQGQYYNISSSTVPQQVPISQGQSTIQIQAQTSISAQTQTIQTSTPSQQVVTNVSLSHHQIQQGGVSQQIGQPASQPQQHNIQLQQQQYAQQIQTQAQQQIQQPQQAMSQSAMQPQTMSQQSMQQAQSMTQQTLQQAQAMQQQKGLPLQQPQQTMSQQTLPQQTMSQQALPQQTISQQAMSQAIQQTQQSVAQQSMSQPSISQQAMSQVMPQPQQAIPQVIQQSQQSMPQVLQKSQQSIQQQVIQQPQQVIQQPQQVIQQPQQVIQQPQQVIQQPQQVIQQPQQIIQQPQQVIQQPQQQVIQQPQKQVIQQPQQQVIQQPQQQVIQQPQQQIIQQPQQQVIQQPQQQVIQPPQQPPQSIPQAMQPQQVLHHTTNLQNLPPQQIHIGTVPNIAPQSQNIPQSSLGQGMLPGHHVTVTGGQGPQMVQVSSVVSSVSQSFPRMSVSQVSSRTVQSSVGLDGTVDQTNLSDPSTTLLESLKEVATSAEEVQPSGVTAGEDAESASGTSAVAIDNKIEQAMDLVKSHLMFAVREEVEVLKEKIAELMDRINQLEVENTILKAHATQETLAQLGGNATQQGNKNQQTQQPPNGSVS